MKRVESIPSPALVLPAGPEKSRLPHRPTWRAHRFRAMGTDMALWLETAGEAAAKVPFARAEALFRHHERVLSRFQAQSELSRLNRRARRWTVVSALLWDVLAAALEMAELTGGRFDPTILNGLEASGYVQSFELLRAAVPGPTPPAYPAVTGDWRDILVDPADRSVFLPAGLRLDLGGIAKGYTAQQAAALLDGWGPCLVDAGGDLVAGAAPAGYDGWPVAVSTPRSRESQVDLFTLPLAHAALATSGVDHRRWQQDGRAWHHLIDPATGLPATTDLVTATVGAERAVVAEAWATATAVQGAANGLAALLAREMPAALITERDELLVTPAMARLAGIAAAQPTGFDPVSEPWSR